MKRVFIITLLILIFSQLSPADELPIMIQMDTYSLDTGYVNIDTAYTQMKELGVTHIGGWAIPVTVQKADEYDMKITAHNLTHCGQISGIKKQNKIKEIGGC